MKRYAVAFDRLGWALVGAAVMMMVMMALDDLGAVKWWPS